MKIILISIVSLAMPTLCAAQKKGPPTFSFTETFASGWVPPPTGKLLYDGVVLQHELYAEWQTGLSGWPKAFRFGTWVQHSLDAGFDAPAGEFDLFAGASGPLPLGLALDVTLRYIDIAGPSPESVFRFGDNDLLLSRVKLDRPLRFGGGRQTLTPGLTWFHYEPLGFRSGDGGSTLLLRLDYEWKPRDWLTINVGGTYHLDEGVNGNVPAEAAAFGGGLKLRLRDGLWLSADVRRYETLGRAASRPIDSFWLSSASLSWKL